jgi:hypothetical protein
MTEQWLNVVDPAIIKLFKIASYANPSYFIKPR